MARKPQLPKLHAWKATVRLMMENGLTHKDAIRATIQADIPAYIDVLRECNYTDQQIVASLTAHTSPKGNAR